LAVASFFYSLFSFIFAVGLIIVLSGNFFSIAIKRLFGNLSPTPLYVLLGDPIPSTPLDPVRFPYGVRVPSGLLPLRAESNGVYPLPLNKGKGKKLMRGDSPSYTPTLLTQSKGESF